MAKKQPVVHQAEAEVREVVTDDLNEFFSAINNDGNTHPPLVPYTLVRDDDDKWFLSTPFFTGFVPVVLDGQQVVGDYPVERVWTVIQSIITGFAKGNSIPLGANCYLPVMSDKFRLFPGYVRLTQDVCTALESRIRMASKRIMM